MNRKEVAKLAGVSEATVSRVLNGVGPVKEATKRRVLEAAKQLDYYPSAIAQSFARRRSGNLGVILPFVPKVHLFSTYYFAEILSGIGDAVKRKQYDLLLLFRSADEPVDYIRLFRTQKVDACIILGSSDMPEERKALSQLAEEHAPFCLVNQRFEGERFNLIEADHVQGSYEAVKHLIEGGHRRIAFLNGPLEYSNSADRLCGYKKALAEADIPFRQEFVLEGNYSRKSGYLAAEPIAGLRGEIDAVFSANDRMATGLIQGLRERGISFGRDLALVGYDDSDAAKLTDPQLTSVRVPFFEMGRLAAEKVLEQLSGDGPDTYHETLPTELVIRGSSQEQD